MPLEIPSVVIDRLPGYVRVLGRFADAGQDLISSEQLGAMLDVSPAQIRRDLSYFGRFGRQGSGYEVMSLLVRLREILQIDRTWRVCLLGAGRLGRSVAAYGELAAHGFRIVAVFDSDERLVGTQVEGLEVRNMTELEASLDRDSIEIAIIAVPPEAAQRVSERLVAAGIRSILNYSPAHPRVPASVAIRNLEPVMALQAMTFHLTREGPA